MKGAVYSGSESQAISSFRGGKYVLVPQKRVTAEALDGTGRILNNGWTRRRRRTVRGFRVCAQAMLRLPLSTMFRLPLSTKCPSHQPRRGGIGVSPGREPWVRTPHAPSEPLQGRHRCVLCVPEKILTQGSLA